jgi:hypothetical protein
MEPARCTKCGASTLVAGQLLNGLAFIPRNTRIHFGASSIVPLRLDSDGLLACLSCGHLGTLSVDPKLLRASIENNGSELARQQLACFDGARIMACRSRPKRMQRPIGSSRSTTSWQ